jgi:fatty acid desaturase
MAIVDRSRESSERGAIPVKVNLALAVFYTAANFYQFFFLPLFLLPRHLAWAWTLVPLALLNNPFWSLLHEAIHDLFSAARRGNVFFGRLLAICFGSPFAILRLSHLLHHKLNRSPAEGTEYYDNHKTTKAAAAPGYYFQILGGLYLIEVISPLPFFLPRRWIKSFKDRQLRSDSVSGILVQSWLIPQTLRAIRIEGLIIIVWLSMSLYCYGARWPLFAAILAARGILISFLDNVYHYDTPVSGIFYAKNLSLSRPLAGLLLHFNLHGVHHLNPAIPWIHLPKAFKVQAGEFGGDYFAAAWAQLRGPIALQDLPAAIKASAETSVQ